MLQRIFGTLFFLAGFLATLASLFLVDSAPQGAQLGAFAIGCLLISVSMQLDRLLDILSKKD